MLKVVPSSEMQDCPEKESYNSPDLKVIPGGLDELSSQSLLTHNQVSDVLNYVALVGVCDQTIDRVLSVLKELPVQQIYSSSEVMEIGEEAGLDEGSVECVLERRGFIRN